MLNITRIKYLLMASAAAAFGAGGALTGFLCAVGITYFASAVIVVMFGGVLTAVFYLVGMIISGTE